MTFTTKGTNAQGQPTNNVTVYEKQSGLHSALAVRQNEGQPYRSVVLLEPLRDSAPEQVRHRGLNSVSSRFCI